MEEPPGTCTIHDDQYLYTSHLELVCTTMRKQLAPKVHYCRKVCQLAREAGLTAWLVPTLD
jgi:hypothetical protein